MAHAALWRPLRVVEATVSGVRAFMIPSWTEDIGAMKAAGYPVYAVCSTCRTESPVDLDDLMAAYGPRYSLWNRRDPCSAERCDDQVWYRVQPGSAWQKILKDALPEDVAPLHARWQATLPSDLRDTLPLLPMIRAADLMVVLGCGRCDHTYYLGADGVAAWVDRGVLTLIDLTQVMADTCGVRGCEVALDLVARSAAPKAERPPP